MKNNERINNLTKIQKYRKLCEVAFENGECKESSRKMLDLQASMLDLTTEKKNQVEKWFNYQEDQAISDKERYKFLLRELKENEKLNVLDKENLVKKLIEIQISESEKNLLEKEVLNNTLNQFIGVKSEDQIESEESYDPRMMLKALDSEYKES